jgi:uncharacterized damage-inducible protein DinB
MRRTDWFLSELESEAAKSKRALEQVPEGKRDWKPHERSMPFGYLCELVAMIPSWVGMAITLSELDIAPKEGPKYKPQAMNTSAELVAGLDKAVAQARDALQKTTDEFLQTPWRLLAGGQVVMELPRETVIRDTFLHSAHHRGQLTVYLRLLDAKVPALYGPSADDRQFA